MADGRHARAAAGRIDPVVLVAIRSAVAAGAAPSAALAAAVLDRAAGPYPPLARIAREARLGRPLADIAPDVDTGLADADLLVRALGVAERAGAAPSVAVEQAAAAARDQAELTRLLRARTAQARGTALLLAAIPPAGWLLLLAVAGGGALGFYRTPLGAITGGAAVLLAAGGQWWSRRILARAAAAGADSDPLAPQPPRPQPARALAAALPALAIAAALAGPAVGIGVAAAAAAIAARPRSHHGAGPPNRTGRPARGRPGHGAGGAAESVELLAVALAAGLSVDAAVDAIVDLAPPPARPVLAAAGRRLRSGWAPGPAFGGTGLAAVGDALQASHRWGAPAAEALGRLAADLRADRRAAAEEAAERTQLLLVFPTTLLTLPAFALAVVPPLLWTAFTG
jgi:Flp pilus assembly protein TadB